MTTTLEERLSDVDFSHLSKVKDSLLLRLKLRRQAILEERNDELSLEALDYVTAAGNPYIKRPADDNKR
ncbi:MAG: hypothetical protein IJ774_04905 [Selenomonadaceae bacterium]|nr:hypothetical protein [Selenomonadaceae bacterium]